MRRWEALTDIPARKRGDRLLRTLPWELQSAVNTAVHETVVLSEKGFTEITFEYTGTDDERAVGRWFNIGPDRHIVNSLELFFARFPVVSRRLI